MHAAVRRHRPDAIVHVATAMPEKVNPGARTSVSRRPTGSGPTAPATCCRPRRRSGSRCWSCSNRCPPPNGPRSCCTTCSGCRSPRSPMRWGAPRRRAGSWLHGHAPTSTGAHHGSIPTRTSTAGSYRRSSTPPRVVTSTSSWPCWIRRQTSCRMHRDDRVSDGDEHPPVLGGLAGHGDHPGWCRG